MLHGVVATRFEDIVEADEVGLDVGVGVGDRIANTSLGSEVYDDVEGVILEQFVDQGFVSNIALYECPPITQPWPQ